MLTLKLMINRLMTLLKLYLIQFRNNALLMDTVFVMKNVQKCVMQCLNSS